jgi:hypothetical protein
VKFHALRNGSGSWNLDCLEVIFHGEWVQPFAQIPYTCWIQLKHNVPSWHRVIAMLHSEYILTHSKCWCHTNHELFQTYWRVYRIRAGEISALDAIFAKSYDQTHKAIILF